MPDLYTADTILPSIDWNNDDDFADALEDVSAYWQEVRFGFGTHRRSNPQRPTPDFGSGTLTLLGERFVPGTSDDLTEAQIQRRHKLRVNQGPSQLLEVWVQEGRHVADNLVTFRLEGLLERAGREHKEIEQSADPTTSTSAAVVDLLRNAFGLASLPINLNATPLSAYEFNGPASRYASDFAQVSGGLPTADGIGGLGLYDATKRPSGITTYTSTDYLLSRATTEFDQEQLWNAALIQYDGPETNHSGTGTGSVTDPGSGSSSGVLTNQAIATPAEGFRIEDLAARLTVGAATGQWRELEGDPGSGNGSGVLTDPGLSDLRGVNTDLTLNDPAAGHAIEDLEATLTVGAATGTWQELVGDAGSGTGTGTVTDPGAGGASGVRTTQAIANPATDHVVEDMEAALTVGTATGTWQEIEGTAGSGNASGTVTNPGQSDLRGVDTGLTLNDPAAGHVIEELDATLTVGAATGTWEEIQGDPHSGSGSGSVRDPGAFGASGVLTDITLANPDANHRVEDMGATFTVGAATASYTRDDRSVNITGSPRAVAIDDSFKVAVHRVEPTYLNLNALRMLLVLLK